MRTRSPRLLLALATSCTMVTALAQPLGETPPGLVSVDRLLQKEAELKMAKAELQAALDKLKQAPAKPAPDPQASAQLQQTQAELAEARKRIASLEAQVREAEHQRDEARAAAQRAQAATKPDADAALRAERDRLKRELARSADDRDRLQNELTQSQQALQAAQQAARSAASKTSPALASSAVAPATSTAGAAPKTALADGQELAVPGCAAACPSFVVLPTVGKVTMGTGNEAVTVDFKYHIAMGKTEVTVAQWKHFMADSGYQLPPNNSTFCNWKEKAVSDQHPVRCVSAEDADAYAAWFNKKYGAQLHYFVKEVRLPSSAEWEYAARAGRWTQERQWDEGKENCAMATSENCSGKANGWAPDPAAKKGRVPNAWGLFDMIGNVWEWTATAETGGSGRMVRGGSFYGNDDDLRLSARDTYSPGGRDNYIGFRLLARIDL